MPISVNQILTWCGVANARRAAVIAELMPNGLTDLDYFTTEDIQNAIKGFARNPVQVADRFNLSAACSKRITQLALWVKDRIRADHDVFFENETTAAMFIREIGAAQTREIVRKVRTKSGETLTSQKIDPPLKTSGGWDAWSDSVQAALGLSYGARGVPLLYIIRPEEDELFAEENFPNWEARAVTRSPHEGEDYESDLKTVHVFLLNNISETSDAYAYILPHLTKNDGRLDWTALQERYESDSHIQTKVAEATAVWDGLIYKNERAMSFEAFSRKISLALQAYARAGRPKHEADIVDWLWSHIQCPEMTAIIGGLKATHNDRRPPRTYADILGLLAKEVPNLNKPAQFGRHVSQVRSGSSFTFDGDTPAEGAMTADGKLFCGGYSNDRWRNDLALAPFKSEILALREKHNHQGGKNKGKNKGGGKKKEIKQARRKLQQVKQKLKAETRKLAALQIEKGATSGGDIPVGPIGGGQLVVHNQAGDAFGGRASMGGTRN